MVGPRPTIELTPRLLLNNWTCSYSEVVQAQPGPAHMAAGQQVRTPLRARLYCRTWRHCNNNNAIKSKKWSLWRWLRNETYKPQNSRDQALVRRRFPFAPPLCRFRPIREPGDEAIIHGWTFVHFIVFFHWYFSDNVFALYRPLIMSISPLS